MSIIQVSVLPEEPSPEAYLEKDAATGIVWVCYDDMRITKLGDAKGLPDYYVHPEPGYNFGRCKMIKVDGERCKQPVGPASVVCEAHGAAAGRARTPGMLKHGKYSKHLPTRLLAQYEQSLQDPGILDLSNEIALLDTKIAEELQQLEYGDVIEAIGFVRQAYAVLQTGEDDIEGVMSLLSSAIEAATVSDSVWRTTVALVEERRRLVDTERKRQEDAGMYLSVAEANALLAYVVNTLVENVKDQTVLAAVSEKLKIFASGKAI